MTDDDPLTVGEHELDVVSETHGTDDVECRHCGERLAHPSLFELFPCDEDALTPSTIAVPERESARH